MPEQKMNSHVTQEQLFELFDYKDGGLYWKKCYGQIPAGSLAGTPEREGYVKIMIKKRTYLAHRLIFLFHHGVLPRYIDHINHVKSDNRVENLREATLSQNQMNTKKPSTNTSGYKCVTWNKRCQKWQAIIIKNRKTAFYGLYDDINIAANEIILARERVHGSFANHA
jgi:hypothetical protein